MTSRSLVGIVVGALQIAGCAQGRETRSPTAPDRDETTAPAAAPAPASAEPEPATLEEAEAALERARAELETLALHTPGPPSPAAGAPASRRADSLEQERAADTAAEAAPARRDRAPSESAEETEKAEKKAATPCDTACKAFASLRRARDAVCRLDDPSGTRCARADGIVRDAGARVATCRCGP